jgi:hypothetical protein
MIERDAYGRAGEWMTCDPCCGSGVDYGETCVTCGGFGWIRAVTPFCPDCELPANDGDGVVSCPNCGWSEEDD